MKLKNFNLKTLPKINAGRTQVARVTFTKYGTIAINARASTLMGLAKDTKITLSQDEDDKDNWYFYIDPDDGFPVRVGYDKKGVLFNHAGLVKEVVEYFELSRDRSHGFLLAGKPTTIKGDKTNYWCLIKPVKI